MAAGLRLRPQGEAPEYDVDSAGQRAVAALDANKNGSLDAKELEKCPGLLAARERVDSDGNSVLTADEISTRVKTYGTDQLALMPCICAVTLDGEPLPNAEVTLTPEEFLGPQMKPRREPPTRTAS